MDKLCASHLNPVSAGHRGDPGSSWAHRYRRLQYGWHDKHTRDDTVPQSPRSDVSQTTNVYNVHLLDYASISLGIPLTACRADHARSRQTSRNILLHIGRGRFSAVGPRLVVLRS